MSLRWRLAVILAVVGAVAIGAATLTAWYSTRTELREEIDQFVVRRAEDLVSGRRNPPESGPNPGRRNGSPIEADASIQTLDASGDLVADVGDSPIPIEEVDVEVAQGEREATIRDVTVDGLHRRVVTMPLPGGGAVQVARDLTEVDDVLSALAQRLALVTLGGALLVGLIGWLVARQVTRPLRSLATAATTVADTQVLTTPVPVERRDEVGQVAESFNTMLSALETSRRQQHHLVQDASHELRTPLTSLRTSIEVLNRTQDLDSADARRLLDRATFEVAELSELVAELVDLATDAAADEPETDLDLADVVDEVVAATRRRTNRTIELDAAPSPLHGRPTALARAVRNLVDNACKFGPPDQPVEVSVSAGRVVVRDRGPGIPAEDRDRVFDRFYRSTETRTQPGSGLGLAIVAQVVAAHGGRVWATDAPGGGAEVGFQLPT